MKSLYNSFFAVYLGFVCLVLDSISYHIYGDLADLGVSMFHSEVLYQLLVFWDEVGHYVSQVLEREIQK